jgi:putative transposase
LGLRDFFLFYNNERFHQSPDYRTPAQIYLGGREDKQDKKEKTSFYQPASILIP